MSKFQKIMLGCLGSVAAVVVFFAIAGGMYLVAKQTNPNFDQIGATATPIGKNNVIVLPTSTATDTPQFTGSGGYGDNSFTFTVYEPGPVVIESKHTGDSNFIVKIIGHGGNGIAANCIGTCDETALMDLPIAGVYTAKITADGGWTVHITLR